MSTKGRGGGGRKPSAAAAGAASAKLRGSAGAGAAGRKSGRGSKASKAKKSKRPAEAEASEASDPFAFDDDSGDDYAASADVAAATLVVGKKSATKKKKTNASKERVVAKGGKERAIKSKRALKRQKKEKEAEDEAVEIEEAKELMAKANANAEAKEQEQENKPRPKRVARKSARGPKKLAQERADGADEAAAVADDAERRPGDSAEAEKTEEAKLGERDESHDRKEKEKEEMEAPPVESKAAEDKILQPTTTTTTTAEQLQKRTVAQLKSELKKLHLPINGPKRDLIARYLSHVNAVTPSTDDQPQAPSRDDTGKATEEEDGIVAALTSDGAADVDDTKDSLDGSSKTELAGTASPPDEPQVVAPKGSSLIAQRDEKTRGLEDSSEKQEDGEASGEVVTTTKKDGNDAKENKKEQKVKAKAKAKAEKEKQEKEHKAKEKEKKRSEPKEEQDVALVHIVEDEATSSPVEVLVPNSLPASQIESLGDQREDDADPTRPSMPSTEVPAETDASVMEGDTKVETQRERQERKRRRKESLLAEEIDRVYRERIETEKRLREMTDREDRLKRRQAERKERIKTKAESTPTRKAANKAAGKQQLAPRVLDADDDAWLINSSPLDLPQGDFVSSTVDSEPASAPPTTSAPSLPAEIVGVAQESPKPAKRKTETAKGSPKKRARPQESPSESRTSAAKPSKKRRRKDDANQGEAAETQKEDATGEDGAREKKHAGPVEGTSQDEELCKQEEALLRRLTELDEERQRVKDQLERVKSEREQLRIDSNTTTKTTKPTNKKTSPKRKTKEKQEETAIAAEEVNGRNVVRKSDADVVSTENGTKRRSKRKREDREYVDADTTEKEQKKKNKKKSTQKKKSKKEEEDPANDKPSDTAENEIVDIIDIESDGGDVHINKGKGEEGKAKESTELTLTAAPKLSFRWRVGFASLTGGRPENQDAYIVPPSAIPAVASSSRRGRGRRSAPAEEVVSLPALPSPVDSLAIFGVLDGHGLKGQYAAQAGSKYLHAFIAQSLSDLQQDDMAEGGTTDPGDLVKAAIQAGIRQTQEVLLRDGEESGIEYGTTAVVCVQIEDSLIIGNVGDSRAVLFRSPKTTRSSIDLESVITTPSGRGKGRGRRRTTLELTDSQLTEVLCSHDHRPWRKEEADRVERESNGRGHVTVGSDGKTLRVFPSLNYFTVNEIRAKKLGLAMTRSLGHAILSTCGVSSEPEFFSAPLQDGDKLIIGCDGLWDVLTNTEAMKIVSLYAGQDPQAACDALVSEAERRWERKSAGGDNITAVVVFFNST